jgi:hypothetical protein
MNLAPRRSGPAQQSAQQLEWLIDQWKLQHPEAALLFGVTPGDVEEWRESGVPAAALPTLAELVAIAEIIARHVKQDRIPAVLRRPIAKFEAGALLDLARGGRTAKLREAVRAMLDLRRVQP